MTMPTRMLFKIADKICAEVPSALCNILSTQEHAPGVAASYVPVFATKVKTLEEYWEYVDRIFFVGGKDSTANLILDDGGGPWFYFAFTYFVKLGLHDGGQGFHCAAYKAWFFQTIRLLITEQVHATHSRLSKKRKYFGPTL